MRVEEEHLDILQNIEAAVAAVYHDYPELTDYDVDKAFAALGQTYHGEAVGKPAARPAGELAGRVYDAAAAMCDWRMGRAEMFREEGGALALAAPAPLETILACLKRLRKSVEHWTRAGGRQGYLDYIDNFV